MSTNKIIVLPAELVVKVDENRGEISRAEFIDLLLDSHLGKHNEEKNQGFVTWESLVEFESGIKERLRNFLECFITYSLEVGKESGNNDVEPLIQRLKEVPHPSVSAKRSNCPISSGPGSGGDRRAGKTGKGRQMRSIFIQAPTDKVFEAMCDLTRHAKWAAHEITIEAGQEAPPAVGNTYTSSHTKATAPDRLTVTEMSPNERFVFHSVMPNSWELDFTMTSTAQGDGTLVTREAKVAKMPALMFPFKLLLPVIGGIYDKKLLNNMKADLEGPD